MNYLQKISAEWPLRIGLAATYLYSGYDIVKDPTHWLGYLPGWFSYYINFVMPASTYLQIQGAGELAMALILLFWLSPRWLLQIVAALSVLEMAGILFLSGIDLVTFRDFGILGASAALFIITMQNKTNETKIV